MVYRLIILTVIGGILGFISLFLARLLIKNRGETPAGKLLTGTLSNIIWISVGMLIGLGIALLNANWSRTIELILLAFILLSLSLVDAKIRKIPNSLLMALIALRLGVLIYGAITGKASGNEWLNSLIGSVAGWLIFTIPSMIGLTVGWGDVKFAAVSGLYLKIIGMVQAMLVMSFIILIYGLVLIIAKKGSFKTAVAYGPALSVGIVVTTLLPLAEQLI